MENIMSYVVVQSHDDKYNISPIPKTWIYNKTDFNVGEICSWYWPPMYPIKKSESYSEVEKDWIKKFGLALNTSGSFLSANFIVIEEKLKLYTYVIVEFIKEKSTEVVPTIWIKVDSTPKQFFCQWPKQANISKYASQLKKPSTNWNIYVCSPRKFFNDYSDAKRELSSFCDTSTTEIEDFEVLKARKRKPPQHYDSSSEDESSLLNRNTKKRTIQFEDSQLTQFTNAETNKVDCKSTFIQKEPNIVNIPKPKESFNIFDSTIHNSFDGQTLTNRQIKSPEMFSENCLTKSIQKNDSEQDTPATLFHMMNNIGHAIMDVSNTLGTLKKEIGIIKLDVIKNQELLTNLTENSYRNSPTESKQKIDRGRLKLPVDTLEDLNAIEQDDEKIAILSQILQRDAKSYDAKRSTYYAMRMIMENKVAEYLNMEGRRGDKTAFVKFKIFITLADCIKDFFPQTSLVEIKSHVSDWLKQAPRRK